MDIRLIPLAAVVLALAAPLSAEVVEQSDNGFTTRNSAVVSAKPFAVWQALIAPGTWWNDSHTWSGDAENMYISAQASGCFCELLPDLKDPPQGVRRGSALHMTVLQADPPRVLRMRGGLGPLQSEPVDGVLTITISEREGGTAIVWEYLVGGYFRYEVPTIAKAVDGVMTQQLDGLATLLGKVASDTASDKPEAAEDNAESEDTGEADDLPKVSVDEAFGDLTDEE